MALTFPNRSRSFDETRKAVRFLAHDGMFEVTFFIESSALVEIDYPRTTAAECLLAFDAARSAIQEAAQYRYSNERRSVYLLTGADLR